MIHRPLSLQLLRFMLISSSSRCFPITNNCGFFLICLRVSLARSHQVSRAPLSTINIGFLTSNSM